MPCRSTRRSRSSFCSRSASKRPIRSENGLCSQCETRVRLFWHTILGIVAMTGAVAAAAVESPPAIELFNGRDLDVWANVDGGSTGRLVECRTACSSAAANRSGFLPDCRHVSRISCSNGNGGMRRPGGNRELFVACRCTAANRPRRFSRAIEVQLFDSDHGSIFGIRGATIVPLTSPRSQGWDTAGPAARNRCLSAGQWNRYVLTSKDGTLELAVNGQWLPRPRTAVSGTVT